MVLIWCSLVVSEFSQKDFKNCRWILLSTGILFQKSPQIQKFSDILNPWIWPPSPSKSDQSWALVESEGFFQSLTEVTCDHTWPLWAFECLFLGWKMLVLIFRENPTKHNGLFGFFVPDWPSEIHRGSVWPLWAPEIPLEVTRVQLHHLRRVQVGPSPAGLMTHGFWNISRPNCNIVEAACFTHLFGGQK